MDKRVCFFTSVCEEDEQFVKQYLDDCSRLQIPTAIHFDRCSQGFKDQISSHPMCIASTSKDETTEFREMDKQAILNSVVAMRFKWACAMDIDETWEKDARRKIDDILLLDGFCEVDVRWVNLWNDPQYIRVDGAFKGGHRVKFLRLPDQRQSRIFAWRFDHPVVNGPKLIKKTDKVKYQPISRARLVKRYDLVCLHWGMMTCEMRERHKQRWDRIYSAAVGANPYGFWNSALDESTLKVERHDYL